MSNAIVSLAETMQLGSVLAESGFFSDSRGAAQAVVKVLAGRELGLGPVASMTGIYIVKGRVTLSANMIAGAIKRAPGYDYKVKELSATVCRIEFMQDGELVGESTFTMENARTAKLAGGTNWTAYPRNMLFARAISNGAKWYCPDIFAGPVYTPDELGADIDGETGDVIDGQSWPVPSDPAFQAGEEQEPAQELQLPTNGNVYTLPEKWAHLAGLPDNLDFDALTWKELALAAVSDLGYNHSRHVTSALVVELGTDWHKIVSKSQAWAILKERKAED